VFGTPSAVAQWAAFTARGNAVQQIITAFME
jgi:hypothetical protein